MKTTIALLMLMIAQFGTQSANAQQNSDGKDAAYTKCAAMPFDKDACMKIVTGASFFSTDALAACSSPFGSEVNSCLSIIANKYYETNLAQTCAKMTFSEQKNTCLGITGNKTANATAAAACNGPFADDVNACLKTIVQDFQQQQPPRLPPVQVCEKAYVLGELDAAINNLKNYKIMPAFQRVMNLRAYLLNCMQ